MALCRRPHYQTIFDANALATWLNAGLEAVQACGKAKTMVATVGKAKTLGERSLGHADPEALSMSLLLKFMNHYLQSR